MGPASAAVPARQTGALAGKGSAARPASRRGRNFSGGTSWVGSRPGKLRQTVLQLPRDEWALACRRSWWPHRAGDRRGRPAAGRPGRPMTIRLPPAVIRLGAREIGRRVLNPALPWEVQRRRLDRLVGPWPLPRGTSVTKTALNGVHAEVVAVGQPGQEAAGLTADPRGGAAVATVVHFHGGGYCVGSPAEARSWAARLSARAGCRVVLPDYRLAPEHPHPAAVDDAREVMSAALGDAAPGTVVVSGDSAGGGLALGIALTLPGLASP